MASGRTKWNPYFDSVQIMYFPKPVPPKQRKSGAKNKHFENVIDIIHKMDVDKTWYPQSEWPWTENLFVMLEFYGPKEFLKYCDIDNLSKAALDAYKGKIYKDDRQIICLLALKRDYPTQVSIPYLNPTLAVAVKKMKDNSMPDFIPSLLVSDEGESSAESPFKAIFQIDGKNHKYEFLKPTRKDIEKLSKDFAKAVTESNKKR